MNKKLNNAVLKSVVILILLCISSGCIRKSIKIRFEEEKLAPDFYLKDTKGKVVQLKDFAGKIIVLNFFATWCPPCRREIPEFIELYKEYESKGVVIIGISLDIASGRGNKNALLNFIEKEGVNYPILLGDRDVADAYGGIPTIPRTFIIDKKGIIRKEYKGYQKSSVIEGDIKTLLAEQ